MPKEINIIWKKKGSKRNMPDGVRVFKTDAEANEFIQHLAHTGNYKIDVLETDYLPAVTVEKNFNATYDICVMDRTGTAVHERFTLTDIEFKDLGDYFRTTGVD